MKKSTGFVYFMWQSSALCMQNQPLCRHCSDKNSFSRH